MCTAVSYKGNGRFYGRTLDWVCSFSEKITVTPRNFKIKLRNGGEFSRHYAIIGAAKVEENYPLYFDAANECGLFGAGLNFPQNAGYLAPLNTAKDIASFEFIPFVLGQCDSVASVLRVLKDIRITDTPFSEKLPPSPLHWMFSDGNETVVAEPTESGLKIYENPFGVLTNNPPFEYHLYNVRNYMSLSTCPPENTFGTTLMLTPYSYGMGALGLPGDYSSASRFIRAAFVRANIEGDADEYNTVFRILSTVTQPKGCTLVDDGYEYTVYTSCIDGDRGIYYYKTYDGGVCAVNMYKTDLSSERLSEFGFLSNGSVFFQNG